MVVTRYIVWLLYPSTIWFAPDTICYSKIARAPSPRTLANLSFECLLAGWTSGSWKVGARNCDWDGLGIGSWYLAQRGSRERGPRGTLNVLTISSDGHPHANQPLHWL